MEFRSDKPLRDNERSLIELLQSLDSKYPDLLLVVEGQRDERVLRNLGVMSKIIKTQTQQTRTQLVDHIVAEAGCEKDVLILTDFDAEGSEIALFLEHGLELHRVKILEGVRIRIRNLMGNWRCVEEMVALFKRVDSPEPSR